MTSLIEQRKVQGNRLIKVLYQFFGTDVADVEEKTNEVLISEIISLLEEFDKDALPYAAVTVFVYSINIKEFPYFISELERELFKVVEEKDEVFIKCVKLLEHLELAQQQKDSLFEQQRIEIEKISNLQEELSKKTEKVEELSKQVTDLIEKNRKLEQSNKKMEESNKGMITNFISILGIFAAILMGAFGAIQGFTSLFQYANDIPLGKALILSAVGGSSVLLILFLLLNAISKLTGRPLSNSEIESDPFMKKHPTLIVVFGLMILIALCGAALELSKIELRASKSGWWWVAPIIWIIYFVGVVHSKSLVWKKK
ncbi:hypothetical protein [Bacillus seohaeanensis]|uniref:Uncharacterized protein n=1 Tax=Bacillus seohaeanensis TaxID=284580 RepID=A0ABW5RRP2_9BACI